MGYYLELDIIDNSTDIVLITEIKNILKIKKLLRILKLKAHKVVNNGVWDVKKEWVGLLQPYFKEIIQPDLYSYQITFGYSTVPNCDYYSPCKLNKTDIEHGRYIKRRSILNKFRVADKIRRRFKGSDLIMIVEREKKNKEYVSHVWEAVDLKNDLSLLNALNAKFSIYSHFPHIELTRKNRKIISQYLTKKLASTQTYKYTAFFYFSRKTKYVFC